MTFIVVKKTGFLNLRYPTIPGFYFIFLSIMSLSFIIPSEATENFKLSQGYQNFLLGTTLHYIFFLLGILVIYKGQRFDPSTLALKLRNFSFYEIETKIIKYLTVLAVLIFIHSLIVMKSIPIVEILRAGADESLAAEATINKESLYKESISLNNYIWNLNRQILFPILILYSFVTYFKLKTKRKLVMFLILLIVGVANNAISGSLAPVALIFFMLGISFLYLSNNIKPKHYVSILVLSLAFPIFVDFSSSNYKFSESVNITLNKTFYRFSGETFKRSLDYFEVYGVEKPFLGGRTHKIFTYVTGEEYFNVSNYIFVRNLPVRKLAYASTGHQNAHFICYLYSDFGFSGIVIGSLIVGLILAKFQLILNTHLTGNLSFVAYVILVTLFWKLMGVHPFTILFSHGALLLVIMTLWISKKIKKVNELNFLK
jgi:hypothetical protein